MSEHHPYLEFAHLISLTWLAYPILSLGFVIFNLQLALSAVEANAQNAKSALLSSCYAAQAASSASASLPRYIAISLNKSYSTAINDSLNAAQAALDLSITVVEAVIDFFVDTYRSTFLCFLELAVLAAAVAEVRIYNATTFVESAANSVANAIQQSFSAVISGIQSAISAANKVPGINIPTPTLSPPDMSSLQSLTLPTTFEDQLNNLNTKLPTLNELRQIVDNIINTPFSDLKADINTTFASLSTDPSIFPIPDPVSLTFCDRLDTSMIDDLSLDLKKFATWCTVTLIVVALLMIVANCTWLWYQNRRLTKHLRTIRGKWNIDEAPDGTIDETELLSMHSEISHPTLCLISKKLRLGPSLEWLFFYVFHPPSLSCLLIGVCGMIVTRLQIWGLERLHSDYAGKISTAVTTLTAHVIYSSLNESITNQSAGYATTLNSRMDEIQTTINSGVFGWINTTTTLLNATIAGAYDVQNAMNSAFGGTVLDSPIQNFIQCVLGNKVDEIETVLTFLQTNLVINVPRLNSSALLLSDDAMSEVVQAIAEAAVGGTAINPTGLVGALVDSYGESLKKEQLMYEIFTAFWVGVVVLGASFIMWGKFRDILTCRGVGISE
ncbi:hypothetical protein B0H10DRAFT_2314498 [Mycena sp. CBHHK59/15]|nr:hypothetical protein B0H10DRAFT_2314498 [Mycena sp. CBHHK59/15]